MTDTPSPEAPELQALLQQSQQSWQTRQWQAATSTLLQALPLAQSAQTQMEIQTRLGRVYARQQRWPEAQSHWKAAYALAQASAESTAESLGPLLHQLGRASQEQQAWPEAEQFYLRALEQKRIAGQDSELGQTYHQLGRVYEQQQQLTQAQQAYAQAVDWMQQTGQHKYLGLSLFQLACIQAQLQQGMAALGNYTEALGHLSAQPRLKAEAFYRIGVLFTGFQRPAEAQQAFEQALPLYAQSRQSFWVGMTHLKLGLLFLAQGQVADVLKQAQQAVQALEKKTASPALQMAYELLAELNQMLGQRETAQHWSHKASQLQLPRNQHSEADSD